MAPEVGLEPTTLRLTAACSTIELLWNSEEAGNYRRVEATSNRFRTGPYTSASLATGTKECAPRGLHDPPNATTTTLA